MTEARKGVTAPYIRKMRPEDVEEIYNMGKDTPEFAVSDSSSFWERDELESWIKGCVDDVLLVAEIDGKIAGFILTKYHKLTKTGGFIDTLVKEEYRRRGIGEALVNEAKTKLLDKGATYLYATIQATNSVSKNLFKSAGFSKGYNMTWMEFVPKKLSL